MNRERAKELAPIIAAFGEGKTIDTRIPGSAVWLKISDPCWVDGNDYRIAPEPKLRPWKQEEVLPLIGKALCRYTRRLDNSKVGTVALLYGADSDLVYYGIGGVNQMTFKEAMIKIEHSTDGGVTWKSCGVVE